MFLFGGEDARMQLVHFSDEASCGTGSRTLDHNCGDYEVPFQLIYYPIISLALWLKL
jgi:hypothetical protein